MKLPFADAPWSYEKIPEALAGGMAGFGETVGGRHAAKPTGMYARHVSMTYIQARAISLWYGAERLVLWFQGNRPTAVRNCDEQSRRLSSDPTREFARTHAYTVFPLSGQYEIILRR